MVWNIICPNSILRDSISSVYRPPFKSHSPSNPQTRSQLERTKPSAKQKIKILGNTEMSNNHLNQNELNNQTNAHTRSAQTRGKTTRRTETLPSITKQGNKRTKNESTEIEKIGANHAPDSNEAKTGAGMLLHGLVAQSIRLSC
ncbi:unnamed protein product [Cuscuta epithymum]|uniref:Uncharacterized protein n=1 Tax=Cuscuta epithymum TaxID=186058 RepID=A0AAV0D5T4_9ASTE|nr:unnamed protein product [Cuscuta epithymum]CAH9147597.1 unnamed protein product [Cuscuta epithymum]